MIEYFSKVLFAELSKILCKTSSLHLHVPLECVLESQPSIHNRSDLIEGKLQRLIVATVR